MGNEDMRQFEVFYTNQGDVVLHRLALAARDIEDALNIAAFRVPVFAKLVKLTEDGRLLWTGKDGFIALSDQDMAVAFCQCRCHLAGSENAGVSEQQQLCDQCDCD